MKLSLDFFGCLYRVFEAKTDDELKESFNLRHKVFAEEKKWEPLSDDRSETDEYDQNSIHILMQSRADNQSIGYSRIIIGKDKPIARLVSVPIDSAEVSRLLILEEFRRSVALLFMFSGIYRIAQEHNIKTLVGYVEPFLFNRMKKVGIPIQEAGEHIDYKGKRMPFMIDIQNGKPNMTIRVFSNLGR